MSVLEAMVDVNTFATTLLVVIFVPVMMVTLYLRMENTVYVSVIHMYVHAKIYYYACIVMVKCGSTRFYN